MNHAEVTATVVANMSAVISASLVALKSEEAMPSRTGDASDDLIKFHTERVESLRELRDMFENEMARQMNQGF